MDFMKDEQDAIVYYNSLDEAVTTCGMYEFENAWVMQLIQNHTETE